jgi:alpha-L-fucosidase
MCLAQVLAMGVGGLVGVVLLSALLSTALTPLHAHNTCPTGFANFGDSLTDTGNAVNAFALSLDPENSPYGSTFFGKPAKRFSDGRVVPDFFCGFQHFVALSFLEKVVL